MNNKIAMVNKELHTRLFDEDQFPKYEEQEPQKIYRRSNQLPPQLMLKDMIKKGLTNAQPLSLSRPKTAQTTFKRTIESRQGMDRLRSTANHHFQRQPQNKRYEQHVETNNNQFDFNRDHPRQFNEFDKILDRMKFQREQQKSRKMIKLERYGQKKFRYAWKRSNIPL